MWKYLDAHPCVMYRVIPLNISLVHQWLCSETFYHWSLVLHSSAFQAVERLNIKPSFWKDLLTDEPFTRKDLITVQDPNNLEKFNLANFYHVQKNLKVLDPKEEAAKKGSRYHLKGVSTAATDILNELDRTYKPAEKTKDERRVADAVNAAHYSTGRVAASFTSTVMGTETHQEAGTVTSSCTNCVRT